VSGERLRHAAIVQVVLEGVALPARRQALIAYAQRQNPPGGVLAVLERIPDREYAMLDEVGEAIAAAQPRTAPHRATEPRPESGDVPGGPAYVDAAYVESQAAPGPSRTPRTRSLSHDEERPLREPAPSDEGTKKRPKGKKPSAATSRATARARTRGR
jgi:hypothetical protein